MAHFVQTQNDNFVFIDSYVYKVNKLSVNYVINKKDTCIAVLKIYKEMLLNNSLFFGTRQKLDKKLSKLGAASLDIKIDNFDNNYLLSFVITSVANKFNKSFKNIQLESARLIKTLIDSGISDNKTNFKLSLTNVLDDLDKFQKDPFYSLRKAVHLNFLNDLVYGSDKWGLEKEYQEVKFMDLEQIKKALDSATCFVTYIGDCNANTLTKVHDLYKPTPAFAGIKQNDFIIKDEAVLESDNPRNLNEIAILFSFEKIESIKTKYIASMIQKYVSKELNKLVNKDYRLPKVLKIETSYRANILNIMIQNADEIDKHYIVETVKLFVLDLFNSITEEEFNKLVNEELLLLAKTTINVDSYNDFLIENRLLNLSSDVDKHISVLKEVLFNEFKTRLNTMAFVGSISLLNK